MRKITKGDTVSLKNGKTYRIIRITKNHVDLQKKEHEGIRPSVSGYVSWNLRGFNNFWTNLI